MNKILQDTMLLKISRLANSMPSGPQKKRVNIEAEFLQVIENTYRKDVHFSPLQDVDENKCSYTSLSKMCMKRKGVRGTGQIDVRELLTQEPGRINPLSGSRPWAV